MLGSDKGISDAFLVRRIHPTELALIHAMTNGFPEQVKRRWVLSMIKRYLTWTFYAYRSKQITKQKVARAEYFANFEHECNKDIICRPSFTELLYGYLAEEKVLPIHLSRINSKKYPPILCEEYQKWQEKLPVKKNSDILRLLEEPMKPDKTKKKEKEKEEEEITHQIQPPYPRKLPPQRQSLTPQRQSLPPQKQYIPLRK